MWINVQENFMSLAFNFLNWVSQSSILICRWERILENGLSNNWCWESFLGGWAPGITDILVLGNGELGKIILINWAQNFFSAVYFRLLRINWPKVSHISTSVIRENHSVQVAPKYPSSSRMQSHIPTLLLDKDVSMFHLRRPVKSLLHIIFVYL